MDEEEGDLEDFDHDDEGEVDEENLKGKHQRDSKIKKDTKMNLFDIDQDDENGKDDQGKSSFEKRQEKVFLVLKIYS